ncbi:hypothetical protein COY16_03005 [Candidatus Roizmanbacteria bacterium CG_4_10_14_0_2_um_filter_39_13]|uniref:ABC transporter domain-containing protein n=1 Tax=Candidatus Roizmanbacteria bacterium CG_4_10_14_0_2_um_filter_39_13 TaxID=1974825 RepID=A0A2M7TYU9_9BACT|nr:MAG: hypothetical protein COY16_03005 [Candidatus Roizmanbacteria bacterium CG_4_10_14_0_2_um_filter_39_13]
MDQTLIRFNNVSFEFAHNKPILDEVSFSVRSGAKITLMGQNGAGKSTLFKILTGVIKPDSGQISINKDMTIATAPQVMSREDKDITVLSFFQKRCADVKSFELKRRMNQVLNAVNLVAPEEKIISSFSGGQQARLLLASALIQNPDTLLLDEPTNNLDPAGIEHLMYFLMCYEKTCIVISHDADFLNAITDGVLYLDTFTHKVEYYAGNYNDVVEDIAARIEKENRLNARMEKGIQENKDKANFFAQKGGKMRNVAKKMREKIEKMEEEKVETRKEDRTIRPFTIEAQEDIIDDILTITSYSIMKNHVELQKTTKILMVRRNHLQIKGPNGIGKSSLIESIAKGTSPGSHIHPGIRVGYYRQDFSTLNFDETVFESLTNALIESGSDVNEVYFRSTAAKFLITADLIQSKIGDLSEGQKGLVSFARLVLLKPGLLILDEPTNHINFRHIPVIAKALNEYEGAMILVSHVPEFVSQIRIDTVLDLEK